MLLYKCSVFACGCQSEEGAKLSGKKYLLKNKKVKLNAFRYFLWMLCALYSNALKNC